MFIRNISNVAPKTMFIRNIVPNVYIRFIFGFRILIAHLSSRTISWPSTISHCDLEALQAFNKYFPNSFTKVKIHIKLWYYHRWLNNFITILLSLAQPGAELCCPYGGHGSTKFYKISLIASKLVYPSSYL